MKGILVVLAVVGIISAQAEALEWNMGIPAEVAMYEVETNAAKMELVEFNDWLEGKLPELIDLYTAPPKPLRSQNYIAITLLLGVQKRVLEGDETIASATAALLNQLWEAGVDPKKIAIRRYLLGAREVRHVADMFPRLFKSLDDVDEFSLAVMENFNTAEFSAQKEIAALYRKGDALTAADVREVIDKRVEPNVNVKQVLNVLLLSKLDATERATELEKIIPEELPIVAGSTQAAYILERYGDEAKAEEIAEDITSRRMIVPAVTPGPIREEPVAIETRTK